MRGAPVSNRTDFDHLAPELGEIFSLPAEHLERLETELHNAYVAGQEGNGCDCRWCRRLSPEDRAIQNQGATAPEMAALLRRCTEKLGPLVDMCQGEFGTSREDFAAEFAVVDEVDALLARLDAAARA
jgi:hypothetical protein